MKKIYEVSFKNKTVKVYRDPEIPGQYILKFYSDNVHMDAGDYFTDDRRDAIDTADWYINEEKKAAFDPTAVYKWTQYPNSKTWEQIADLGFPALVRTSPLPDGFMWQVDKHYGYAATIEEAKKIAEEAIAVRMIG